LNSKGDVHVYLKATRRHFRHFREQTVYIYFRKIRNERKLEEKLLVFFLFEDCLFPSKVPFQKVVGNPSLPLSSSYCKNQLNNNRGVRSSSLLY